MLTISGLTVKYGSAPVVHDVFITVAQGSVTGLVGANGAGKTTTLGAVAATRPAAAGDILFDGRSILGMRPEDIVRAGIALVPENRRIFGSLSVGENIALGARIGRRRAVDGDLVDSVLDRFPVLKTNARKSAGTLSGGEQQQLAIARALVTRPRLLMLDEPSLGLAPRIVDVVFGLLEELRSSGQTILLVEQNVHRTLRFADHSYVLRGGRVSLEASREEFMSMDPSLVEYAFFGESHRSDAVVSHGELG
jgi:branched-chain amino acid transport system ATP-binding protein